MDGPWGLNTRPLPEMTDVDVHVEIANSFNRFVLRMQPGSLAELAAAFAAAHPAAGVAAGQPGVRAYHATHGFLDQLSDRAVRKLMANGDASAAQPIFFLGAEVKAEGARGPVSVEIEYHGEVQTFFPDLSAAGLDGQLRTLLARSSRKPAGAAPGLRYTSDAVRENEIDPVQLDQFVRDLAVQPRTARSVVIIVIEDAPHGDHAHEENDHCHRRRHRRRVPLTLVFSVVLVLLLLALFWAVFCVDEDGTAQREKRAKKKQEVEGMMRARRQSSGTI